MQVPDTKAQEMWVEAGSPPEQLSDGNYIMSYNIADGDLWWGIGQCAALHCMNYLRGSTALTQPIGVLLYWRCHRLTSPSL